MVEVKFYDTVEDSLLKFAVIIAKTKGKWVFCKHRERDTYEVPGGRRENGETILETARRELQEETGAVAFDIKSVCVYSVKGKTKVNESIEQETFGMLYVADIVSFEVPTWTYRLLQSLSLWWQSPIQSGWKDSRWTPCPLILEAESIIMTWM